MIEIKEIETKKDKIRAYISEITFNNGESLSIESDDIVLFVGPNNAGKSQALNDIYVKSGQENPTVVISSIKTQKDGGSLFSFIKPLSKVEDQGDIFLISFNGRSLGFNKNHGEKDFKSIMNYGSFKDFFICKLSTENRLSICYPANILNRDEPWTHPIHYAAYNSKYADWLTENFNKAFGVDLTANSLHGATIPLCIGPQVKLENTYKSEQERLNAFADILESYKQVQMQGDGIKSFTGILLNLMLDYYCTYLIDEPESFLHPPQARIMGQIIGNTLGQNQQAFISTHSEDIVKGLLDVCDSRLKIIRITREEDKNYFSILDNQKIKEVFGDPLLKYSNIMSSLFHKTVVLCESDSDCKMYSVIESHLKQEDGKYSETLFIHCGGKQRMARTAGALRALNIDVKLIPDIDVLNDKNIVKGIAAVFGIEWESIEADYNNIVSNLHSSKENIKRAEAKLVIDKVLNASSELILSQEEIKQIQDSVKIVSKWTGIKSGGKHALPAGDATKSFQRLDETFRNHNIYIVPVGELEGFVKGVGGHGPEWVNSVLEQYPDLNNPVYNDVRDFIREINL